MKFNLKFYLFLFSAIFFIWQTIFAFDPEIETVNVDEVWTVSVAPTPSEAIDSSDAAFKLLDETVLCHADETWNYGFDALASGITDSTDASFAVPVKAQICHADEIWDNGLDNIQISNSENILAKTPVLFVPGLLGTEMFKGESRLWASILTMLIPFNNDTFMDPLKFNDLLMPDDKGVFYGSVLANPDNLYDYTQSLINEFLNNGYVENKDFITFPYDWRYGVSGKNSDGRTNSDLLKVEIDLLSKNSPTGKVDVIAHSMGGLIVKKYIMDNSDPKIDKLVFVGTPNLGSPVAAETLLLGNNFRIPGLSLSEMKKISQNMPAAYDLLPSEAYFTSRDGYLRIKPYSSNSSAEFQNLDYAASMNHLAANGLNTKAISGAILLHSNDFDSFDVRMKGIKAYNIIGCKSGTFHGIIDNQDNNLVYGSYIRDEKYTSGDDTVPFESADSIPIDNDKKFYMPLASHGQMPSQDGVRQMIASIITGSGVPPQIIPYSTLKNNPSLCQIRGDIIKVLSPLDIFVTEIDNGKKLRLCLDADGNIIREIPGADFDVFNGHKYLFLPQGDGEIYSLSLQGSGTGTFTLIDEKIEGEQAKSTQVFNDIPVTPGFSGALSVGNTAQIVPASGPVINPTSVIQGDAAQDMLAPKTVATISGQMGKQGFYRGKTAINLVSQDLSQDADASGVFSITYQLDNNATSTVQGATTTIPVGEGSHKLIFFADDKLGNKEIPQTINFIVDNTAPEIQLQFDPEKKDLAFTASDNISAPGNIVISDQNGVVTATDEAGNTVQLSFKDKNRLQSLRAQLNGLAYNSQTADVGGVQLAFAWFYGYSPTMPALIGLQSLPAIPATLPKTGPLSFLLQQAKLKDGTFVAAVYGGKNALVLEYKNKKLTSQTFSGLKLLKFATTAGSFSWGY